MIIHVCLFLQANLPLAVFRTAYGTPAHPVLLLEWVQYVQPLVTIATVGGMLGDQTGKEVHPCIRWLVEDIQWIQEKVDNSLQKGALCGEGSLPLQLVENWLAEEVLYWDCTCSRFQAVAEYLWGRVQPPDQYGDRIPVKRTTTRRTSSIASKW